MTQCLRYSGSSTKVQTASRCIEDGPRRWACSVLLCSVSSVSCRSSNGYLRMRWIGLMRNDSSVAECCWFGLCERRNSCRAMFDSETVNKNWYGMTQNGYTIQPHDETYVMRLCCPHNSGLCSRTVGTYKCLTVVWGAIYKLMDIASLI